MSKQYGEAIPAEIDRSSDEAALRAWLARQMSEQMPWLLAHADDGVIWGKRQPDGRLVLSSDVFDDPARYPSVAVKLQAKTLQEARIFGTAGEVRLWRTAEGFEARRLTDEGVGLEALSDEEHLLWHQGNPVAVRQEEGFALLQEGAQGQRHAPPVIPQGGQRPKLVMRHYVDYDPEGQAYIALSRLVGVEV
ncbi:MAG: CRISPR-associated protein Csx19 [Anaerolineae bacterium]